MAGNADLVKFYYGTQAAYDNLVQLDSSRLNDGYLYFITDSLRIYRGREDMTSNLTIIESEKGTLPLEDLYRFVGKYVIVKITENPDDPKYRSYTVIHNQEDDSYAWVEVGVNLDSQEIVERIEEAIISPNPITGTDTTPAKVYTEAERNYLLSLANAQPFTGTLDGTETLFIFKDNVVSKVTLESIYNYIRGKLSGGDSAMLTTKDLSTNGGDILVKQDYYTGESGTVLTVNNLTKNSGEIPTTADYYKDDTKEGTILTKGSLSANGGTILTTEDSGVGGSLLTTSDLAKNGGDIVTYGNQSNIGDVYVNELFAPNPETGN